MTSGRTSFRTALLNAWLIVLLLTTVGAAGLLGLALARNLNPPPQAVPTSERVVPPIPTRAPTPTLVPSPTPAPTATLVPTPTPAPTQSPTATTQPAGDVVQGVIRGVVQVRTNSGLGTGFRVEGGTTARFVTNAHVVGTATRVSLVTSDGKSHAATVLKVNAQADLVVLTAVDLAAVPVLRLASDAPRAGDPLYVVGFALGSELVGDPTVTRGVVSGRRTIEGVDYLQTDAAMNPGNSGGPVINGTGQVIGVASMGVREQGGVQIQGINFAISSAVVKTFLDSIR